MKKLKSIFIALTKRKILFWGLIVVVLLWLIGAFVFCVFEGWSFEDAIYWSIILENISPKTAMGKIMAVIEYFINIGILGIIVATAVEIIIERVLSKRKRETKMKNHIVVCGWDNKLKIAVRELLDDDKDITVVANADDLNIAHENLEHIKGDPSDESNLLKANIANAQNVLISGANDTETLLCALAIEKIKKDIEITCVVDDPRVIKALQRSGVDQIISIDEFFGLCFSRSVFVPRLTSVLKELLSNQGMDFYEASVSEGLDGYSIADAMASLKHNHSATLIGIVKDKKLIINPVS